MTADDLQGRAAALRQAFDGSFAKPLPPPPPPLTALLAVRIAGRPHALPLTAIAGLFADVTMTKLPSTEPALVGITALRGAILPVYDLAALLGYGSERPTRWVAVTAGLPAALAFAHFERYLRLPQAVTPPTAAVTDGGKSGRLIQDGNVVYNLVDMPAILETIRSRARASVPQPRQS